MDRNTQRQAVIRGLFGQSADPQIATRAPGVGGMAALAGLAAPVLDNFLIQPAQKLWDYAKIANTQGYGALPVTAPTEMVADAAGPGWTHGALGALKEGLDPSFLAANFGGKRHGRFLPHLWHGVKNSGATDNVVDTGFQRGRSAELGLEGTSITPDPRVAKFFAPNGDTDDILRVDTDVKPQEVFNLRPSHYLAANAPTDVPLLRKPQSYYSEAEYWIPGGSRPRFSPRRMFQGDNSGRQEQRQLEAYLDMKEFPTGLQRDWRLKQVGYGTPKQQGNYKDLMRDIGATDSYELSGSERAFAKKFYPWMAETEAKLGPIGREINLITAEMNKINPRIDKKKSAILKTTEYKDEYGNSHGIPAANATRFDDLYRRKNQLAEELRRTMEGIQVPSGAALKKAEDNLIEFSDLYFRSGRDDVLEETLAGAKTPQDAIALYRDFANSMRGKKLFSYINAPEEIKPQSEFEQVPWSQADEDAKQMAFANAEYDELIAKPAQKQAQGYSSTTHKAQGNTWDEAESLFEPSPQAMQSLATKLHNNIWPALNGPGYHDLPSTWNPPYSSQEHAFLTDLWKQSGQQGYPNMGDPASIKTWLQGYGL